MLNRLVEDEALKLNASKTQAVHNHLEKLRAEMTTMPIKEKILKMVEQKQLQAQVENLRE